MRKLVRQLFDIAIAVVFNIALLALVIVAVILLSWWSAYFDLRPDDLDRPELWKLLTFTPVIIAAGVIVMRAIFLVGYRVRNMLVELAST